MGVAEILAIIGGIFKFWDEVVWLVKLLQSTPQEKKDKLAQKLREEADNFEKTGRPTWD